MFRFLTENNYIYKMKRELNNIELEFIEFLHCKKRELTERKRNLVKKKIDNFKGSGIQRKKLKASKPLATWKDVRNHIENKYSFKFFDESNEGKKVSQWKRSGVPKHLLQTFQLFYLNKKIIIK